MVLAYISCSLSSHVLLGSLQMRSIILTVCLLLRLAGLVTLALADKALAFPTSYLEETGPSLHPSLSITCPCKTWHVWAGSCDLHLLWDFIHENIFYIVLGRAGGLRFKMHTMLLIIGWPEEWARSLSPCFFECIIGALFQNLKYNWTHRLDLLFPVILFRPSRRAPQLLRQASLARQCWSRVTSDVECAGKTMLCWWFCLRNWFWLETLQNFRGPLFLRLWGLAICFHAPEAKADFPRWWNFCASHYKSPSCSTGIWEAPFLHPCAPVGRGWCHQSQTMKAWIFLSAQLVYKLIKYSAISKGILVLIFWDWQQKWSWILSFL